MCLNIIPGGAQAQHGTHALTNTGDGVSLGGAFVVICGATSDIGRKGGAEIGGGVVPAHGLTRVLGGGDFGEHFGVACGHAGEVHHLSEANDAGPCHCLGHVLGGDFVARGFQTRRGGRAGGHLGEDVDRLHQRFVMHHAHTGQAEDIGDLMRIGEHRRRTMGDHRAGEFCRGQHAGFDVHMPVTKAGDHVAPVCLDNLGLRAGHIAGIRHNGGDPAGGDGDVVAWQGFAAVDIDPDAALDHRVGGRTARGDVDQAWGSVRPGGNDVLFHVPIVQIARESASPARMARVARAARFGQACCPWIMKR